MDLSNEQQKVTPFYKRKKVLAGIIVLFVFILLSILSLYIYTEDNHTILSGVSVSSIKLGSLTIDEAIEKLEAKKSSLQAQELVFTIKNEDIKVPLKELGLDSDPKAIVQQAYSLGRSGNLISRAVEKFSTSKGLELDLPVSWNDLMLTSTLKKYLSKFETPATDATFKITDNNTMEITEEKIGLSIDFNALAAEVKKQTIANLEKIDVKLLEKEKPRVLKADLEKLKITGLMASYTTKFDPGLINRTENIRLASKAFDQLLIKPGEIVPYNKVVGPRTVAAGYKDAMIIENGRFVPGLGGGICQVSSTLFNALLYADLEIVKRFNHALAIAYVPLGQDATVAYPDVDLVFKNSTQAYLLIRTKINGDSLTFEIYGQPNPAKQVIITNKVESTFYAKEQKIIDDSLAPGQMIIRQGGQPGHSVLTFRTVKINGQVQKEELVAKSYYQASPKIIVVGKML